MLHDTRQLPPHDRKQINCAHTDGFSPFLLESDAEGFPERREIALTLFARSKKPPFEDALNFMDGARL
jgi:hypothetical protein